MRERDWWPWTLGVAAVLALASTGAMLASAVVSSCTEEPTPAEPSPAFWVRMGHRNQGTYRAQVPGGWLIRTGSTNGLQMLFLPDPEHEWTK